MSELTRKRLWPYAAALAAIAVAAAAIALIALRPDGPPVVLAMGRSNGFVLFNGGTGETRRIDLPLAEKDWTTTIAATGGQLVYLILNSHRPGPNAFSAPLSVRTDLRKRRVLGTWSNLFPSIAPGRVWVTNFYGVLDLGSSRRRNVLHEITPDGRNLRSVTLPLYSAPLAQTKHGWIIEVSTTDGVHPRPCRGEGCPIRMWLWDPVSGRALRRFPEATVHGARQFEAAHGDIVAWNTVTGIPAASPEYITDLRSGRSVHVSPPPGASGEVCYVISPDGRMCAGTALLSAVYKPALVDTRTGRSRLIPGPDGAFGPVTWSPSSQWVFFGVGRTGENEATGVAAYRIGARSAKVLDVHVRSGFGVLVAGDLC